MHQTRRQEEQERAEAAAGGAPPERCGGFEYFRGEPGVDGQPPLLRRQAGGAGAAAAADAPTEVVLSGEMVAEDARRLSKRFGAVVAGERNKGGCFGTAELTGNS
jgi:hypothetical protein